jgi:DNA-3-methyladenine glycosylase II
MTELIACEADLLAGMDWLAGRDPVWNGLVAATGIPPLRRREAGFASLVAIVVGQQLSVASAAAVLARVEAVFVPLTPERVLAASEEEMRLSGLSRPKQRSLRAIATALATGDLDLAGLAEATPEQVHARMTAVSGIGPWTADLYLITCLGHRDGFPAGDLAIQEAARVAFGLPQRPSAMALARMAEDWRPWRGVAARVLWSYYALLKRREGVGG